MACPSPKNALLRGQLGLGHEAREETNRYNGGRGGGVLERRADADEALFNDHQRAAFDAVMKTLAAVRVGDDGRTRYLPSIYGGRGGGGGSSSTAPMVRGKR